MYDALIGVLKNASAVMQQGRRGPTAPGQVTGWNELCKEAHSQARDNFLLWVQSGNPRAGHIFETMRRSRSVFKLTLRQCQKDKDRIQADRIANQFLSKSSKSFWNEIKKVNGKASSLSTTIDSVSGEQSIADLWGLHYKNLLNLPGMKTESDHVNAVTCNDTVHLSVSEIYDGITNLKKGKSAGCDGISAEHFLYAHCNIACVVTLLFNACISHHYLPGDLMKTVIVPIVKNNKGDVTSRDNYRPIAITTVLSKLIESVLLGRYRDLLHTTNNQFGFKKGHSTDMAIFVFKNVIEYYVSNSSPVYISFVDASKAFDRVNHCILFAKLQERKIPRVIVMLIMYWYSHQQFQVRWGTCMSDSFRSSNGVRQGGILSPFLFNLYIDDLSHKLNASEVGCHMNGQSFNNIVYADDMVLLVSSPSALQKLLDICDCYASDHDIVYNVKKSKYMVIKPKLFRDIAVPHVFINDCPLESVSSYSYLGVIITNDMYDDNDIARQVSAIYSRGNSLIRNFRLANDRVKIQLFKTFICNFYCAPLWSRYHDSAYKRVVVAYKRIFRNLFQIQSGSITAFMLNSGCDPFVVILRKSVYGFRDRILHSDNDLITTMCNSLYLVFSTIVTKWNNILF